MSKCAICKENEATQKHHLTYNPDIIIEVCVPCHVNIHSHGVGQGKDVVVKASLETEEHEPLLPSYTKQIIKNNPPRSYIVHKETEEILNNMICPNGCKSGWFIYQSKEQSKREFYLRCVSCGYDLIMEITG